MADICELRYVNGNFNALDVDDMVVIFKGNVYVLNEEDGFSDHLMHLVKELCNTFPSVRENFFYNDGALKMTFIIVEMSLTQYMIIFLVSQKLS